MLFCIFEEKESVAVTQNSANRKSSSTTFTVLTVHVCSVYDNDVKRILTGSQEKPCKTVAREKWSRGAGSYVPFICHALRKQIGAWRTNHNRQ